MAGRDLPKIETRVRSSHIALKQDRQRLVNFEREMSRAIRQPPLVSVSYGGLV